MAVVAALASVVLGACGGGRQSGPTHTGLDARGAAARSPAASKPSASGRLALIRAVRHQLRRAGAGASASVYDLTEHRTLLAARADTVVAPASVEKLYTSAALLRRLGPSARLQTVLLGHGSLARSGVWRGDLYLRGGGDPSLGSARFNATYEQGQGSTLDPLAARLRALGIRRVTGRIYGDESRFDTRRGGPSSGYATDIGDLGGELGALTFDHGSTLALVRARRARYVQSPAVEAAVELARALREHGIRAAAARIPRRAPDAAQELARTSSPTLLTLVRLTDEPSDDFYAEMLTKQLGLRFGGGGTTASGARVIAAELAAYGIHPRVVDGSGLSRADRTTVRDVVTLLSDVWGTPLGAELERVLPVAGESGTLVGRLARTPARGRCRAKTGTLNYLSSLAGYCHSRGGDVLAFTLVIAGVPAPRAHSIRDGIVVAMADHDPAAP